MRIKAAVLGEHDGPFQIEDVELADPLPGEVRVATGPADLCAGRTVTGIVLGDAGHQRLVPRWPIGHLFAPDVATLVAKCGGHGLVPGYGDGTWSSRDRRRAPHVTPMSDWNEVLRC